MCTRKNKNEKAKKSDEENQKGQGLKILTPNQMLSRLSISLSQLKAGKMRKENYYVLCIVQKN